MHIYLVVGEMLLCMPMEMIIDGLNLKTNYGLDVFVLLLLVLL